MGDCSHDSEIFGREKSLKVSRQRFRVVGIARAHQSKAVILAPRCEILSARV